MGDFNLTKIDWTSQLPLLNHSTADSEFILSCQRTQLTQHVSSPTYYLFISYVIYYHSLLNVTPLNLEMTPCWSLECAAIKVMSHLKSVLFVCFYRPPSRDARWITKFHECLEYLQALNLPLVIAGDFNKNLIADNTFADDMEISHNLKQLIKELTRIAKKSCTLIDHIYVSNDVSSNSHGTFELHLSDHRATYIQLSNFHVANTHTSIRLPASKYRYTNKNGSN